MRRTSTPRQPTSRWSRGSGVAGTQCPAGPAQRVVTNGGEDYFVPTQKASYHLAFSGVAGTSGSGSGMDYRAIAGTFYPKG